MTLRSCLTLILSMRAAVLAAGLLTHAGAALAAEPLLGLYTFEQADGRFDRVVDASGQGRHPVSSGGVAVTTGHQGLEGEAAIFRPATPESPARGFEVEIDITPGAHPDGLTIGGWVNLAVSGDRRGANTFFSHADSPDDRALWYNRATSAWEAMAYRSLQGTPPSSMTAGEWHLIVATFDGRVRLYLDGHPIGQTEFKGRGPASRRLRFGALDGAGSPESFVGRMDNLFVFGSVLTPAQIRMIQAHGLAGVQQVAGLRQVAGVLPRSVPEAGGLMLAGLGVLGWAVHRRHRREPA
jgi:hypothetical protein